MSVTRHGDALVCPLPSLLMGPGPVPAIELQTKVLKDLTITEKASTMFRHLIVLIVSYV